KRDNRPAVPDGAAVSPSAPPTPRELVAHAHLILRHLDLPGSPPEPRGQMSRADCIAELEAVREFLRGALPSHPDTSSTELAARTDRQNRQVTPVQELLSS